MNILHSIRGSFKQGSKKSLDTDINWSNFHPYFVAGAGLLDNHKKALLDALGNKGSSFGKEMVLHSLQKNMFAELGIQEIEHNFNRFNVHPEANIPFQSTLNGTIYFNIQNFDYKNIINQGIIIKLSGNKGYLPLKVGNTPILLHNESENDLMEVYYLGFNDMAKILLESNEKYQEYVNKTNEQYEKQHHDLLTSYNREYVQYASELQEWEKNNDGTLNQYRDLSSQLTGDQKLTDRKRRYEIRNQRDLLNQELQQTKPIEPSKPEKQTLKIDNYMKLLQQYTCKEDVSPSFDIEIFASKKNIDKISFFESN